MYIFGLLTVITDTPSRTPSEGLHTWNLANIQGGIGILLENGGGIVRGAYGPSTHSWVNRDGC